MPQTPAQRTSDPLKTEPVTQTLNHIERVSLETPPKRTLTSPTNSTTILLDSLVETDENVDFIQVRRTSAERKEQHRNSLPKRVLEVAGQKLGQTNTVRTPT